MGSNFIGCEIMSSFFSFTFSLSFFFFSLPLNTEYVQCAKFKRIPFGVSGIVF